MTVVPPFGIALGRTLICGPSGVKPNACCFAAVLTEGLSPGGGCRTGQALDRGEAGGVPSQCRSSGSWPALRMTERRTRATMMASSAYFSRIGPALDNVRSEAASSKPPRSGARAWPNPSVSYP
jgi:hypothetical protein